MTDPFLSSLHCSSERAVDRLLAEQATATETFLGIVQKTRREIAGLHFPLGSPAHRHDWDDITDALEAWQEGRDPDRLRECAEDVVLGRL